MSTNRTHKSAEHFPLVPRLIATSFGVGYLPKAPGTWGALLAVLLWLPLYLWCADSDTIFYITLAAAVVYCVAGTWASSVAERYWGKDPVVACADETVGMWISLLPLGGVAVTPWWQIIVAFVLFRLFDIYKPLGIRSMERLPRGYGMMADDILAGAYSILVLLLINRFI